MLRVLQWVIINNKCYNDVTIDHDTSSMLPIYSKLTDLVSISVSSDGVDTLADQDSDPYNAHL